ncbi:DUF6161 domain-containing protein [Billgrantia desiderata]|uniref:DUF6161 domain-containing protein n=1 Tax=Billgrantia desiderata TaxID=52021 RepID=UPI003F400A1C
MDINITINDVAGFKESFSDPRSLLNFLKKEHAFWKNSDSEATEAGVKPHSYFKAHQIIKTLCDSVENFISPNITDDELVQKINSFKKQQLPNLSSRWLCSTHPYTATFIGCNIEHGVDAADAFFRIVGMNSFNQITNKPSLMGSVAAYEYLHQKSDIAKRSKTEKKSLEKLRKELEESNKILIKETLKSKDEYYEWLEESKRNHSSWCSQNETNFNEKSNQIEVNFNELEERITNKFNEIESTYRDKLRLEMPAMYWRNSAKRHGLHGGLWLVALTFTIVAGMLFFYDFFNNWLLGQSLGVELNTVQGVLIFASFLTAFGFFVKVLSRLTFSSYHLMRDSQEREQLTYLYLSLLKEGNIDESSRDIVLQALFSRTDSGLLGSDSGITMPGISELLRQQR